MHELMQDAVVLPMPILHRPPDILYQALAMPGCDDFDGERGQSLYQASFANHSVERPAKKISNSFIHTPWSDASDKSTPSSLYRSSFPGVMDVVKPHPRGWREAQRQLEPSTAHIQDKSTAGDTYRDTRQYLREHEDMGRPSGRSMHDSTLKVEKLRFTATSTSRAEYLPRPAEYKLQERNNPDRTKDVAAATERMNPAFHLMTDTTTMRGDLGGFQHQFLPLSPTPGPSSDVIEQHLPKVTKYVRPTSSARKVQLPPAGKPLDRKKSLLLVGGPSVEPLRSLSQASYRPYTFKR